MSSNETLLNFLKAQMDTAKFQYPIDFANQYGSDYSSQIIWGQVEELPNEDEKVFPKYINVGEYYSPEYSGIVSGTWTSIKNPDDYKVEIYILSDTYYLKDSCDLEADGTWKSKKEIPQGFKVIKLIDKTKSDDDSNRFVEYPYSYFVNFKMRLYSLTDAEYLTDEMPIFDVGNKNFVFYTNKVTKGLKVGKVIQRVWRAGIFSYDVVGVAGAQTNIKNGRLPSSYLIPSDDPSFDKDGTSAKGKYGYMLNSRSWIYDLGLALLTFTTSGEYDLCKEILNRMSAEQNSDGSFNFSYDNYIGPLFEGYVRTGAVAWLIWGMSYYAIKTKDETYLNVIKKSGEWLLGQKVTDETDPRYGFFKGGYGSYNDDYDYVKGDIEWCSTEHQVSTLQALNGLYKLTGDVKYKNAAEKLHYNIIRILYDYKENRFYQGIHKDGVDKSWALDCVTWAGLSTLSDDAFGVFSSELIKTALSNYKVDNAKLVTSEVKNRFNKDYSSELTFSGFKPYSDLGGGYSGSPDIVWSEGTLGFILLCMRAGENDLANKYLSEIEKLQSVNNDSGGVLYSTATYGELPWEFHVWECVTSTAWLYLLKNNPDVLFPKMSYSTYGNDPQLLNRTEQIISGIPLTSGLKASLDWKDNGVSGNVGPFYVHVSAEESSSVTADKYYSFDINNGSVDLSKVEDSVGEIIKETGEGSMSDFVGLFNGIAAKVQKGRLFVGIAPEIPETGGVCGIRVITLANYDKSARQEGVVVKVSSTIKVIYDVYITKNNGLVMATDKYQEYVDNLKIIEGNTALLFKNISHIMVSFAGMVLNQGTQIVSTGGTIKAILTGMVILVVWIVAMGFSLAGL